jgi:cathepsin L
LIDAISGKGPASIAIDAATVSFQLYVSGVYNDSACSPNELDHAVIAIGYGTDTESGLDYWIVRNSWGTNWGELGYVRIARKGNICGVASSAIVPTDT